MHARLKRMSPLEALMLGTSFLFSEWSLLVMALGTGAYLSPQGQAALRWPYLDLMAAAVLALGVSLAFGLLLLRRPR